MDTLPIREEGKPIRIPGPPLIFQKIPLIMQDVGAIGKDRRNDFHRYQFRGIDDCYNALHGPLAKHGVFVVPTVLEHAQTARETKNEGKAIHTLLKVSHRFYAEDGSFFECVTLGEAMDNGDKSSNKALSAAMKYALLEVFCIPTEEDNDTENHSHELASTPAQATPQRTTPARAQAPAKAAPAKPVTPKDVTKNGDVKSFYSCKVLRSQFIKENPPGAAQTWQLYEIDIQCGADVVKLKTFDGTVGEECKSIIDTEHTATIYYEEKTDKKTGKPYLCAIEARKITHGGSGGDSSTPRASGGNWTGD